MTGSFGLLLQFAGQEQRCVSERFEKRMLHAAPSLSGKGSGRAKLQFCYIAAWASYLISFPASLLFCFSVFPASLLLCFCAFLLLLFYFFFSSVMCFCCSTSCSFASLLPVFTLSLFFLYSFAFFCSVCILNETLERP